MFKSGIFTYFCKFLILFSHGMLRNHIALTLSIITLSLNAAAPEGYYSSLDGLRDQSLKDRLHEIIRSHTRLSYNSLWDYYPETDVYPERKNGRSLVWDMYSDNWNNEKYYYPNGTRGLNREHSVPKSWWGSGNDAIYDFQAGTDIMHLFPSDGDANMAKSNYPLGEVDPSQVTFSNGTSTVGIPIQGQGGGSSRVFEPDDEYKGDFARVYFYMVTCYQDYEWRYTYMFSNNSYLSMQSWAIDMLLDWSRNDPVSQKELDRNDAVYAIQGNRNPFVDDPELIEYIWGDRQGDQYTVEHYEGDPVLISPVQDSDISFGEVAIGRSQSVDVNVRGAGLTGSITVQLYNRENPGDAKMFSIATSSIPASSANNNSGFTLRVTYSPTSVGEHSARLLFSEGGITGSVGLGLKGECLPVPTLSALTALPATNVTPTSYRAEWTAAPDDEEIDYYVVTRRIYENGTYTESEEQSEVNYLDFTDMQPGTTHTYYVQSSRLGFRSDPSNTITINTAGIAPVAVEGMAPLAVTTYEGGLLRFTCEEMHTGCRIHDISGRLIRTLPTIEQGMTINLPYGAYLITTDQCHTPIKVLVR